MKKIACAGRGGDGSITMEWAREVDIATEGRRVGVHGPVVRMMVLAGRDVVVEVLVGV